MSLPVPFENAVRECARQFPLLHDPQNAPLAYGTSGFRTTGGVLPPVAARMAFVAVLRVWWLMDNHPTKTAGCSVGCMITASHNPAADNGLKLIDHDGGMLATDWEATCTTAANAKTGDQLLAALKDWLVTRSIHAHGEDEVRARCPFGAVQFGRDTRPTGPDILHAVQTILKSLHVDFTDHGLVTTPQLHYLAHRTNKECTASEICNIADFGPRLYWRDMFDALATLLGEVCGTPPSGTTRRRQRIVLDAANGVGSLGMSALLEYARASSPRHPLEEFFEFVVLHDDVEDEEALNNMCGADFTQKTQAPSEVMKEWASKHDTQPCPEKNDDRTEIHYYSFDGDADRVVAFFHNNTAWRLLDGDRMAILFSVALRKWIGPEVIHTLDVGVVQTAYANGASTEYLQHELGLRVYSGATGVKHLHPIAHARDIGVYFEANGHGTVLFKAGMLESKVFAASEENVDPSRRAVLAALPRLLSQVCGDAIADMLACEVALMALGMSFAAWSRLYTDLPSIQSKVIVPNPKVITNTPDERRALTPHGLQEAIDEAVASTCTTGLGRAFVRPSGTEPLVRVYAEASDDVTCRKLSEKIELIVRCFCEKTTVGADK